MISPFANKKFVLGIVLIAFILGGIGIASGPTFHSHYETSACVPTREEIRFNLPCGDPIQKFWIDNNFPNSGGEFQLTNTAYSASCDLGGENCLSLSPNSHTALALSKQPIDFSTIGSHQLFLVFQYCWASAPANTNDRWGMYLTTNGTIPSGTASDNYDPRNDQSVALALEVQDTGSGNINNYLWLQKDPSKTLVSGDITGGVSGTGTLFISGGTTQTTNVCGTPANGLWATAVQTTLNYTGGTSGTNGVTSNIIVTRYTNNPPATTTAGTQTLQPWFNFQASHFYFGFYQLSCGGGCVGVKIAGDPSFPNNEMDRTDPATAPTPTLKPPTLDVGGFFGPIISALINIGIFILNGIVSFFGFILPAITVMLNVIGGFFGMGTLGTQIVAFFATVADFFTKVFGTAFSTSAAVTTYIAAGITLVITVSTAFFNNAGSALASIANLFTFLIPIGNLILLGTHFSITTLITLWLFVGMLSAFKSFDAWLGWFRATEMLFLKVFKFLNWIGEETVKLIARLREIGPRFI